MTREPCWPSVSVEWCRGGTSSKKKKRKTAAAERFCDYTGATIFTAQKMLQAQQFVSEVAEPMIAQPPDARLSSEGLVL